MSGKNEEKLDEIMMRNDECLQTKSKYKTIFIP